MYFRQHMDRMVLLLAITGACGGAGAQGYLIQAGAYATPAEAESAAERIGAECSPVQIQIAQDESGLPYKLRIGFFQTYAEAWAKKSLLNSASLSGVFIVSNSAKIPPEPVRLPLRLPFNTTGLYKEEPADGITYWEAAGLAESAAGSEGATTESIVRSELELQTRGTGPDVNRLRLRLARKYGRLKNKARANDLLNLVRKNGNAAERTMADFLGAHADLHVQDREAALAKFLQLSNNTALPPSVRRESMRRSAALFHALGRYPEAWAAYEQLAEAELKPADRQDALKQIAGLAYELAGRGKGRWSEVRLLCRAVADHRDSPRKVRATAELMFAETFWEEERADEALAAFQAYRRNFSDIPREAHMAALWEGVLLWRLGRLSESREAFEQLAEASRGATDKFAGFEPRARAADWLRYLAKRQGDTGRNTYWSGVLKSEFPDLSPLGRRAAERHN